MVITIHLIYQIQILPYFLDFIITLTLLIIQESEIRIVKKRILRERGESEIFMEIGKTESFVLLPLFSVCVGFGKTKDRLFPSLVLVLVFSLDLEAVPINGGVRAHNIAEMVSCRF